MKPTQFSRTWIILASVLGGLAAGSVILTLEPKTDQAPNAGAGDLRQEMRAIHREFDQWVTGLESLRSQMEIALERLQHVDPAELALMRPVQLPPDSPSENDVGGSDPMRIQVSGGLGWMGFLDNGIVEVLVERGLTPYSAGVAVHVLEASKLIRASKEAFKAQVVPVRERYLAREITEGEYRAVVEPQNEILEEAVKAAVAQLASSLDQLPPVEGTG